jgi:hypothetical protein
MDQVSNAVFPHRALEIQKLWMVQGMKKPYDLSSRKTAAAITKINNCLPIFPLGLPASKFTDQEVIGVLEWLLPLAWSLTFLKGEGIRPPQKHSSTAHATCRALQLGNPFPLGLPIPGRFRTMYP